MKNLHVVKPVPYLTIASTIKYYQEEVVNEPYL